MDGGACLCCVSRKKNVCEPSRFQAFRPRPPPPPPPPGVLGLDNVVGSLRTFGDSVLVHCLSTASPPRVAKQLQIYAVFGAARR